MGVTKIATCCYCGTRAALVLRGKDRHELSCGSCGAPLHNMKMLRSDAVRDRAPTSRHPYKKSKKRYDDRKDHYVHRPQKRRKSKSFGRKVFSEIWDVVEDIFD